MPSPVRSLQFVRVLQADSADNSSAAPKPTIRIRILPSSRVGSVSRDGTIEPHQKA